MMYRSVLALSAITLTTMSPAGAGAQQRVTAVPIEAGGQRCIAWTFVKDVRGAYDKSHIDYRNKCPTPVSFYMCHSEVYARGDYPPCDAQRGSYFSVTAPVGWTKSEPSSARAQQVVVIRECPIGARTDGAMSGRFYCQK